MANMGADALRANLTNPARLYLWEVEFPNPVGGGDRDALKVRCQSTQKPGRSVGRIHLPYKGTAGVNFPGKVAFSHEWACTFVEGTDMLISRALHTWQNMMMDPRTGQGSLDVSIKADAFLRLKDQADTIVDTTKLVGCFPLAIDDVPLSNEDENIITYNVTWAYDYWVTI